MVIMGLRLERGPAAAYPVNVSTLRTVLTLRRVLLSD